MSGYKVRYKPSSKGARELLHGPEMMSALEACASAIAGDASSMAMGAGFDGAEFEADVQAGKRRPHAMAKTTNYKSMAANAHANVLLKALGGGSV